MSYKEILKKYEAQADMQREKEERASAKRAKQKKDSVAKINSFFAECEKILQELLANQLPANLELIFSHIGHEEEGYHALTMSITHKLEGNEHELKMPLGESAVHIYRINKMLFREPSYRGCIEQGPSCLDVYELNAKTDKRKVLSALLDNYFKLLAEGAAYQAI